MQITDTITLLLIILYIPKMNLTNNVKYYTLTLFYYYYGFFYMFAYINFVSIIN